jgi:hypothetical protein
MQIDLLHQESVLHLNQYRNILPGLNEVQALGGKDIF